MRSEPGQESRTAKAEDRTFEGIISNIPTAYMSRIETLSLIHRCYGHLPLSRLKRIFALWQAKGEVVDLGVFRDLHKYVCTICMKSKATRGEHNGIIDTGMLPGQAFGADVTGPV